MGSRNMSKRQLSFGAVAVFHYHGRTPIVLFACVKHLMSAAYLGLWVLIFLKATKTQLNALGAVATTITSVLYLILAVLHLHGLFGLWRSYRRSVEPVRPVSVGLTPSQPPVHRRPPTRRSTWKLPFRVPANVVIIGMNVAENLAHTYQAFQLSHTAIEPHLVVIFCAVLCLRCVVAPWCLFARHDVIKVTLFNVVNSFFGFALSYGFAIFGVVVPMVPVVFYDFRVSNDKMWLTRNILLGRYLVATSAMDFLTKHTMYFVSYLSLRRLTHKALHPRHTLSSAISSGSSVQSVAPSWAHWVDFKRKTLLKVYLVGSTLWGVWVVGVLVHSLTNRQICPSYCKAETRPFLTNSCDCQFVHIDCVRLQSDLVDGFLDAAVVGTSAMTLHITRCTVPRGLPPAVLAPFVHLYMVSIEFTQLRTWEGTLPSSVMFFEIRHSQLVDVPGILLANTPPSLQVIWLEASPMERWTIPSHTWSSLSLLLLVNVSLTRMPYEVLDMQSITDITLRGNDISAVPLDWQERAVAQSGVFAIDLSANQLREVPSHLVDHGCTLVLSWNPIAALADASDMAPFSSRRVVLDDTIYCIGTNVSWCRPKCAHGCAYGMIGNYYCDLACFNEACSFDGADCDSLGFSRP